MNININTSELVKNKWEYVKAHKKEVFYKSMHNSMAVCLVLSILINFVIESISRHSVLICFQYIFGSPMTFFYNSLIIFATFIIAFFVKRRFFVYTVISVIWIGLGVTNGVILSTRTTPFTVTDLSLADAGLSIITNYLSVLQIALIGVAIVAVIVLFTVIFIFAPKHNQSVNYRRSLVGLIVLALIVVGASNIAISRNWVSTYFGNLNYAYMDYGFPYCFVNTWLNTGIDKPKDYSEQGIKGIFTEAELTELAKEQQMTRDGVTKDVNAPNILMLQLESFFDPTHMKNLTFSEDPIPNFRAMKEKYSSGFLTVPAVGAGTANTEFEALTGMRVRFFGPGEYPYKSVLTKKVCESLCYDLKPLGYTSHAIHNHRGAFYGRNIVFTNLGFDTFTSIEYMNEVTKTPKNWAKDGVLTTQIFDALNATKGKDFIYTISVQGHGQYPTEPVTEAPKVTVSGIKDPAEEVAFDYYLEQIKEMDNFVKDLTDKLSNYDEDVVLVMYGDHLPGLDIEKEDLDNGNIYQTEYVIWSNFKMNREERTYYSYQIGAELLKKLGLSQGTLMKYHQNHQGDETYSQNLEALQYDMLYGKGYTYDPKGSPYKTVDMKMGVNPIKINEIIEIAGKYYITGQNFTPFSKISLDGEVLDTIFLNPSILGLLENANPSDVSRMKVSQVEKNKEILSTTE